MFCGLDARMLGIQPPASGRRRPLRTVARLQAENHAARAFRYARESIAPLQGDSVPNERLSIGTFEPQVVRR